MLRESSAAVREVRELDLRGFAHDARALLGHERLPDPVVAWAIMSPSGEPGLRRTLPGAKLEMRRWEGRLSLFRRERGTGRVAVESVLARLLGKVAEQGEPVVSGRRLLSNEPGAAPEEHDFFEWRGAFHGGRFDRVVAAFDGKTLLFSFTPFLVPSPVDRSHESPVEELLRAASARKRPPLPRALPSLLAMPPGGRYGRRPRPARRRPLA